MRRIETCKEPDLGPTTTDRPVKEPIRKPKHRPGATEHIGQSSGEPERGRSHSIAKPGRGRNPGGRQKTTRGGHDAQNQPLLQASRAKLFESSENRSERKPVCQPIARGSRRGYPSQVSRGRDRRLVLPRPKEARTQTRLTQAGYATSFSSTPSPTARTNLRREKSAIPLRGTCLLLLLFRHCLSKQR